jgi:hypothetical protein
MEGACLAEGSPGPTKLVLLVHGIRTRALWQKRIIPQIQDADTVVEPVGYNYFNVFQFLCPALTRRKAIETVKWRIEKAIGDNPDKELIIIAHSFGTYCVACILQDHPFIKPRRLILCGSVVDDDFRWDQLRQQPEIVNDCGTKDIWPCFARSMTWGYGSAGAFGFKTPGVLDRYHPIAHSGFFEEHFASKYWKPIIDGASVINDEYEAKLTEPPWWLSLLATRLFWIPWLGWISIALLAVLIVLLYGVFIPPPPMKKLAIVAIFPSDSFGANCREGFMDVMNRARGYVPVLIDDVTIAEMKAGRTQGVERNLRKAFDQYHVVGVVGPPISEIAFPIASFVAELNPKVPVFLTAAISANEPTWQILRQRMPLFRVGSGIGQRAEGVQDLLKRVLDQRKKVVFLIESHSEDAPRSFGLRFFDEVERQMHYFSHISSTNYQRVTFSSNRLDEEAEKFRTVLSQKNTVVFLMGLDFQMRFLVERFYKQDKNPAPSTVLIGWMNAHMLNSLFRGGKYHSDLIVDISDFGPDTSASASLPSWRSDVSKRDAMVYRDSASVLVECCEICLQGQMALRSPTDYAKVLECIADSIGQTNMVGLGGPIRFDNSGQNAGRSLLFLKFEAAEQAWTAIKESSELLSTFEAK